MSPEEGARVYSQVTVQRALLEVSRVLVPGPGQAPKERGLTSDFYPAPPGQRESVRVGGGDGEAKEEGGRRPASRGYLTTPGCSTLFRGSPGEERTLQTASTPGSRPLEKAPDLFRLWSPVPWSLRSERTGREWEGRGPHLGTLCIVILPGL